jgi:hypothetical protein
MGPAIVFGICAAASALVFVIIDNWGYIVNKKNPKSKGAMRLSQKSQEDCEIEYSNINSDEKKAILERNYKPTGKSWTKVKIS